VKPGDAYSPYRVFLSAPIPLAVMAMPNLSPGAKLLFARLALYAGRNTKCYPSLDRLARDLGTSTDAIGRWLKELTDPKFIHRARKGPGKTAECEFLWHASLSADSAELRNQDSAEVRNQEPDSAESRNLDSAEMGGKIPQIRGSDSAESRNHLKEEAVHLNGSGKRFTNNGARGTAADVGQTSPRFEEAWQKWPGHKARKNRAAQMWVSVVNVSIEDKVFACLDRFRASDLVAKGFVGYMDTWLQQQHDDAWENAWLAPRAQPQRSRQQDHVDGFKTA
jgi:hypothetical protein